MPKLDKQILDLAASLGADSPFATIPPKPLPVPTIGQVAQYATPGLYDYLTKEPPVPKVDWSDSTPRKIPSTGPLDNPYLPGAMMDATNLIPSPGSLASKAIFLGPMGMMSKAIGKGSVPSLSKLFGDMGLESLVAGQKAALPETLNAAKWANATVDTLGSPEAWEQYRIFRGLEGKPRMELPDKGVKLLPIGNEQTGSRGTGQMFELSHPEIDLHSTYDLPPILALDKAPSSSTQAAYSPSSGNITIYKHPAIVRGEETPSSWTSASTHSYDPAFSPEALALHEAQHHIQKIEGFSKGNNPLNTPFAPAFWYNLGMAPSLAGGQASADMAKKLEKLTPELVANNPEYALIADVAHKLYKNTAGEVEARNVQNRFATSELKLGSGVYNIHPFLTMDTPSTKQHLYEDLFKGLGGFDDTTPGVAKRFPNIAPTVASQKMDESYVKTLLNWLGGSGG